MSTAGYAAYAVIAVAFVAFFVMAHIGYEQFRSKAWQAFLMCLTVLFLLLMIMKRATDIATEERARGAVSGEIAPLR